jgi:HAE1 family hydrophobic/amphiphilic exporter-1
MNLVALALKRPVFTWMVSLLIAVLGWMSFERIGLDRYPSVTFPMVSITTQLKGANPETIDASVTRPLESQVNAIAGVLHIQSKSSPGVSQVYLTFELEKNIDAAFSEVQAKVNQVLNQLPNDIEPPQVAKVEAGGAPVIWLALEGNRTLQQLNDMARHQIKRQLENIPGVGQVLLGGEQKRTLRVDLDINRLNAYGLSVLEVMSAIKQEHFQMPGGFLTHGQQEFLLKLDAEFHQIERLKQLPLVKRAQTVVRLEDVAKISDALADQRQLAHYQGQQTVGIGLIKVSGSNTVAIVEETKRRLAQQILPQLEPGVTLRIATDDADYIQKIVASLQEHLWLGTFLTGLVIWLFLLNWRATAIISVSIPISLLGAVAVVYFAGYTFNSMTLLALLLLIGIVVDDAIVVLENIYRVAQTESLSFRQAALKGTRQMQLPVIAASLTLVSIFMAVLFMDGIAGRFFKEFGVVVTIGILVSLWVSLTLIPVLCARFLTSEQHNSTFAQRLELAFQHLENHYQHGLNVALSHRKQTLKWLALIVLPGFLLIGQLGASFMPKEDQGQFIIHFKTPLGSSLAYSAEALSRIESVLQQTEEVAGVFSTIGSGDAGKVNEGRIVVRLTPIKARERHMSELMSDLSQQLNQLPGLQAYVSPPPMMSGQRGDPLSFVIQGPDLHTLAQLSDAFLTRLQAFPELGEVDLDLQMRLPQVRFDIDRQKSALLGLTSEAVSQAINVLAGGVNLAKYSDDQGSMDRYDIQLKALQGEFTQVKDLSKIFIKSASGQLVSLDTVATMHTQAAPAVVPRYDLNYASMFYSTPTVSLSRAIHILEETADGLLPSGYQLKMTGQAEELGKTSHAMLTGLGLSLLLVYMVLASQFNHLVQPLLIMLAQPLAIVGGIVALWLTGLSLNIYSMIGLVLLMGLVAKNAILLVDLTNQKMAEGADAHRALQTACPIRLRPVLMTSLTVVFTMLPAALGLGAGSDANAPLAVAVIGGMISSTALTLIAVPVAYSYWAELQGQWPEIQSRQAERVRQHTQTAHTALQPLYQRLQAQLQRQAVLCRPAGQKIQRQGVRLWQCAQTQTTRLLKQLQLKKRLTHLWQGDPVYKAAYLASKKNRDRPEN